MSDDAKKLAQLQVLAQLKYNAEIFELQRIAQERDAPKSVLDAISQEQQAFKQSRRNAEHALSTFAGMDDAWHDWADAKRQQTMAELARIAQRHDDQWLKTKQAFGRTEALKSMVSAHKTRKSYDS